VHEQLLQKIVEELRLSLVGSSLGKIFQLSRSSFVFDFHRRESGFLFISVDPSAPRLYMIQRGSRDLEKQSASLAEFGQTMKAQLFGAVLADVHQTGSDRVVTFAFRQQAETGETFVRSFVCQLTGRSANLFLLDATGRITNALRGVERTGQQEGDLYEPPHSASPDKHKPPFLKADFQSWSAAADQYYQTLESARLFDTQVAGQRNRLRQEIAKLERLREHLLKDQRAHGNAEEHRRVGDLLLANLSTATRKGTKVLLKDYFAADEPIIEIEVEEKTPLQAEAAKYFARYGKAKRAAEQIAKRLGEVDANLARLAKQQNEVERIAADHDEIALAELLAEKSEKKPAGRPTRREAAAKIPGVRRYCSGDGYEILVGRAAKDNDHLTFRVARAQDLWLHAADYPGSHVVVLNPTRKEIPQRTMIEAAQLAAKFSQASADAKVNVNYTQQKFVTRIKGAAPGLVRLSSFRTITVEPKEAVQRL
jgi:predicted ribosome quality control (RQC) complex YloA/Tae2 family protein